MISADAYFKHLQAQGHIHAAGNQRFYTKVLFDDVPLAGKTVLDVGGGIGFFSFYCGLSGAKEVICLEPELDGSSAGMVRDFEKLKKDLDLPNVHLQRELFQKYDPGSTKFDVVLLHHSINHLNEDACIRLLKSEDAKQTYLTLAKQFAKISKPGAELILVDASSSNFLNDLGIKNPIARTIEWEKHHPPKVWASIFAQAGFGNPRVQWHTFNSLRSPGRLLLGNALAGYLTNSHFILRMNLQK